MTGPRTPQLGDTVAWSSLLLLDGERRRREGTVVAVTGDGWITVEIPQPGSSPMRVSSLPEHFTVVRTFDLPGGESMAAALRRAEQERNTAEWQRDGWIKTAELLTRERDEAHAELASARREIERLRAASPT